MGRTTALHQWHESAGARMTEFAGWDMPVSYERGAIAEHRLVRRSAGLFDTSHMAQYRVSGTGALEYLERLVSARISGVAEWSSTYALLCRDDGGVLDDLFLYRLPDAWLVVANAANRESDAEWFRDHLPASGAAFADASDETSMFAFQGPRALAVMDRITDATASRIPRFGAAELALAGCSVIVGRTGYTGEDGVELFVPGDAARAVWELLLGEADDAGIEAGPIGLAARDSLRFEAGFPLYGHELSTEISPVEARLTWACDFEKEFIGRDALARRRERGVERRLATVRMTERSVPREGFPVQSDGKETGHVASGMYCPTVDASCANVFIPPALAKTGTDVDIEIRGRPRPAVVVKRPLYTPAYRR